RSRQARALRRAVPDHDLVRSPKIMDRERYQMHQSTEWKEQNDEETIQNMQFHKHRKGRYGAGVGAEADQRTQPGHSIAQVPERSPSVRESDSHSAQHLNEQYN